MRWETRRALAIGCRGDGPWITGWHAFELVDNHH
jgi:hypothetical protein